MGLGLDLLPIVQALAERDAMVVDEHGDRLCILCGDFNKHKMDCPWLMAKCAVGDLEQAVGGTLLERAACASCKQPIAWVTTKNAKKMPVDPKRLTVTTADGVTVSGYTSHFATCIGAASHRKR